MNELGKYAVYFLLGGTIVSVSTYLGAQGRPYLAAFASTFPAITGATFILLYVNGGSDAIVAYAQRPKFGPSRRGAALPRYVVAVTSAAAACGCSCTRSLLET